MISETILPLLCKKSGIKYIVFSKEFKVLDFDKDVCKLSKNLNTLSINSDVRESLWEIIGLEDKILKLDAHQSLKIPKISTNERYYDIEIEYVTTDNFYIVYIFERTEFLLDYFKTIQEYNKKTLILETQDDAKNYHELINKNIITFHVDTNGIITELNSVCSYFLGLDENEIIGKHFSEFFHTREIELNNSQTKIFNARNKDNKDIFFHANVIPIKKDASIVSNLIICQDITHIKHIGKGLEYAASHDSLTGLLNHSSLLKKIDELIQIAKDTEENFILALLDIEKFNNINSTFGHHAGDMLLKHFSFTLSNFVRDFDIVSRIDADKFVILFRKINNPSYLNSTLLRIRKLSKQNPLKYNHDEVIEFDFSVVIAHYPEDGYDAKSLLETAYKKMQKYKKER